MSYNLIKDGKIEPAPYTVDARTTVLVSIAMSLKRIADTLEKSATKSSDAVTTAGSEINGIFHVPLGGGGR